MSVGKLLSPNENGANWRTCRGAVFTLCCTSRLRARLSPMRGARPLAQSASNSAHSRFCLRARVRDLHSALTVQQADRRRRRYRDSRRSIECTVIASVGRSTSDRRSSPLYLLFFARARTRCRSNRRRVAAECATRTRACFSSLSRRLRTSNSAIAARVAVQMIARARIFATNDACRRQCCAENRPSSAKSSAAARVSLVGCRHIFVAHLSRSSLIIVVVVVNAAVAPQRKRRRRAFAHDAD